MAQAELFVASRAGRDVGRIAAMIDHRHNELRGEPTASFGFFRPPDRGLRFISRLHDHAQPALLRADGTIFCDCGTIAASIALRLSQGRSRTPDRLTRRLPWDDAQAKSLTILFVGGLTVLVALLVVSPSTVRIRGADHREAPLISEDPAADIRTCSRSSTRTTRRRSCSRWT